MMYNTFMKTNISISEVSDEISKVLQILGSSARIAILISIGTGEACVCHLESLLGWRQAYISQHLMALRKADLLVDRRVGRFIYYSLKDVSILSLIKDTATLSGMQPDVISTLTDQKPQQNCECPHCSPTFILSEEIGTHG